MHLLAKYGVGFVFEAPIPKVNDTDFAASGDWTPATGDVKVSKDGGNVANIGTLPSAVGGTGSVLWTWTLSATEMQAARITIQVVDAAVENQSFIVQTYGNASAQHAADFDDTVRLGLTALPAAAADGAGGLPISDAGALDLDAQFAKLGTPTDLGGGASLADNNADMAGATFSSTTDSQEAIRNRGDAAWTTGAGGTPPGVLYSGTITTASSQTSLILDTPSPADDTYLDAMAIITNQADATQKCFKRIISSVGSTGTITLESDPGVFTITDGDGISIEVPGVVSALTDAAAAVAAIFTHIELFTGDPNETFAGADPASFAGQVNTLMGTPAVTVSDDIAAAKAVAEAVQAVTDVLPDAGALTSIAQEATLGTPAGVSMSADIAAVKSDTADILTDTGTTLPASLSTIAGYLDTEVAAILAAVDTEVAAIKAKTDSLGFTVAGQVDANIQYVNDVVVGGDGSEGTPWGPA